jgi:predicted transcriptional regulator
MVNNELLNSTEISATAKLLYIYLISKPDRWNFKIVSIASQMKESKNTINRYLQELEDLRLLLRRKIATKEGKFTGIAYYVANLDDSTISQKTVSPNLVNISNTELRDIKEKRNLKPVITLEQRKEAFKNAVRAVKNKRSDFPDAEAHAFFNYWTEMKMNYDADGNPIGRSKKFRMEMEKVFDINRRIDTWLRNGYGKKRFGKRKDKPQTVTKNS